MKASSGRDAGTTRDLALAKAEERIADDWVRQWKPRIDRATAVSKGAGGKTAIEKAMRNAKQPRTMQESLQTAKTARSAIGALLAERDIITTALADARQRYNDAELDAWKRIERTSATFWITADQMESICEGEPEELRGRPFVLPFRAFAIRSDPQPETNAICSIKGICVESDDASHVTVRLLLIGRRNSPIPGVETIGKCRIRIGLDAGVMEWRQDTDPKIDAIMTELGTQGAVGLAGFLKMLDHRRVRTVDETEAHRPSRQVRRDMERSGEPYEEKTHYRIIIPATMAMRTIVEDATRGKNLKTMPAHNRRGHLRTDKYGRKRIRVRESKIHGGRMESGTTDYLAHNVGMEGFEPGGAP